MLRKLFFGLVGLGLLAGTAPAFAQGHYTTQNDSGTAAQAVTAVAAPIASAQTASLISGAIGGAISGGVGGGFAPSGGAGGGFAPGGFGGGTTSSTGAINSRDAGRSAGGADKKFGAWMQGSYTSVENSQAGSQMDGSVYNLVGALDYKISDRVVIGLGLGYEMLDVDTTFNTGKLESTGFGLLPYIGYQLTNAWSASLSGGYTWLSYDITRNTNVTGSYDAERWFINGQLDGNYAFGRVRVRPTIGVMYLEEKSDAFRDSSGAQSLENTIKVGRISAGGSVGYAFDKVMPYVKLVGEYDFEKNAPINLGNGSFSHDEDFGGKIGVGFEFYGSNSFSGNIETSYNSLGRTDLDVWSTSARVRVQF